MILETERLYLREMKQSDFKALSLILQDDDVMYAYEGKFNDEETQAWLDNQLRRYQQYNFGLWAVILKETGEMIGQCGLTMQPWHAQDVLEIGYLFQKAYFMALKNVKEHFPNYRKNKYFYKSLKGIYLLTFNKLYATIMNESKKRSN